MPRVPVYDSPKVMPESLNAPLQHEAPDLTFQMERQQQFNQQVHRGLAEASHVLEGMQIEQDETDATRAHGQYIDSTTSILHGTPEKPGILSLHGQNAVDATDATNKALDDARNQIAEGLKTQRAKDLFLRAAMATQRASAGQIATHVMAAQEQATDDASQLRAKTSQSAAVAAYDPSHGPDVANIQVRKGEPGTDESKWDKRADGRAKGHGFLGLLRRPDGGVSSEISVGVEINGKEMDIPLLVPTLTRKEVDTLLKLPVDENFNRNLPRSIMDKAVAHAQQRLAAGLDVFADSAESAAAESAYNTNIQTREVELRNQAVRRGLPPAAVEDYVKLGMSSTYAAVVERLADQKGGGQAAKRYLADHRDLIADPDVLARLDKLVDTSSSQSSAIHLAASLGQEFPGDFKAQYAKLEKLADSDQIDPETLRLARSEIGSRHAEFQAGRTEYEDALFGRAREIANQGGSITQMRPSDLAYLKQNGSLGVRVDALFKPDGERVNDAALFNELIRQSSEDPAAFLRINVATMAGQLSKAHLDYVIKLQGTINRKDAKGVEINNVMNGAVKYAWQNINAANINLRAKPNTAAAERAELFTTALHDALIAAQEANGEKPLTREQARDITLGLLKEEALSGSGYFHDSFGVKKRRVFEMTPEEKAAPWTIPAADRAEIIASLKRQRQPVTEANIQVVFKMQHGVR